MSVYYQVGNGGRGLTRMETERHLPQALSQGRAHVCRSGATLVTEEALRHLSKHAANTFSSGQNWKVTAFHRKKLKAVTSRFPSEEALCRISFSSGGSPLKREPLSMGNLSRRRNGVKPPALYSGENIEVMS